MTDDAQDADSSRELTPLVSKTELIAQSGYMARRLLLDLSTGSVPSWARVAPEQIEAARKAGVPVAFENSIGMRFVLIPAGTFTMGSPTTEAGRWYDETQHEVTLTKPYYLGITEVTNGQYRRFRADHDSGAIQGLSFNGDDQPVVNVSWDDAVAFVGWLNAQDRGRTYRLPTEAEWERACRAGSRTAYGVGGDASELGSYAWTDDNTGRKTHAVGTLAPNAWGLHDMHGNVWEWCEDWYAEYARGTVTDPTGASGSGDRVSRGGSWLSIARDARSATRYRIAPGARHGHLGVRPAMAVTAN